jgi:hypothetical protein
MADNFNDMPIRFMDEGRYGKYPRLVEPAFGDDPSQRNVYVRATHQRRAIAVSPLVHGHSGLTKAERCRFDNFQAEQLDQLLAPIALYPDALLAQILMAATYPLEIVKVDRWLQDPLKLRAAGPFFRSGIKCHEAASREFGFHRPA